MIAESTDLILKNALKLVQFARLYGKSRPKENTIELFVLVVVVKKWRTIKIKRHFDSFP